MLSNQADKQISRAKGVILPQCCLCEQVPPRGIMGGYLINSNFLCESCENSILKLEIGSMEYDIYVERIKKIIK
ncbi:MAG: hypothetical protein GXY50_06045 [Syntrophomonadaceae bacterium]|nr:hypothetical protein [Syntrophomonadaceae bacterium]